MRLLFIINTPAQAYTWRYIISELMAKGHSVRIIARNHGGTLTILDDLGFQYHKFEPVGARSSRLIGAFGHFQRIWALSKDFNPSMVIGFGVDAAVTATRFGKPCIVFTDGETTIVQNYLTRLMASAIVTPDSFKTNLGKKHIRIRGYKELAYLHTNYFKPDPGIYHELGIDKNEKYGILRFNAFDAIHDIGKKGFSISDKIFLVKELEKYIRIFIVPEDNLPSELEKRRLLIPYTRIHHALFYAQIIISDGGTMITEGAILGTPGIICDPTAKNYGIFPELEGKYGLISMFEDPAKAASYAIELIQEVDLKKHWASKRDLMLADKINVTQFMVDLIENYPESLKR
jgi:uncharacterized protein